MPLLNIIVNRVAYPPATADADAWYILITDKGACKGIMSWRPQESEQLVLDGEWTTYKGEKEFAFKSARLDVPTDSRDQLHYVCMRTNGLGAAAEQLIWDFSGEAWMEIKSGDVPRLNGKVYENFRLQLESLCAKSEEVKIIAALMGKGATMKMAQSAWEQWKGEALGVVNADCYRLAELEGYGFKDVDRKIRYAYGIEDADKRRIRAAVVYALRRLTDSGDTVVNWDELFKQSIALLNGYADLISECTSDLFEEGTLKAFAGCQGVSLAADWKAETTIWDFIQNKKGKKS